MSKLHASSSWGEAAVQIIGAELRRILKHEAGTRLGEDPEELHQMRVGTRRLRSALHLFEPALKLPGATRRKRIGPLARALGTVRDLDVQIELLRDKYLAALPVEEQQRLHQLLVYLDEERARTRAVLLEHLDSRQYQEFKAAATDFLTVPRLRGTQAETLYHLLPELFRSQLADLWAHPGWQEPDVETLHALRIAVKRVRYSAEFFASCYGKGFRSLYLELKRLQEDLGIIHDCDVLLGQFHAEPAGAPTPWQQPQPRLSILLRQQRRNALRRFRRTRTRVLEARTRSTIDQQVNWPGTLHDRELFEHGQMSAGALELERKYRITPSLRQSIEGRLSEWDFRSQPPLRQTDYYLEVLGPHQYTRARRSEEGSQVSYQLTRKQHDPAGGRRVEEEPLSASVWSALTARFHQLPMPIIYKERVRWSGFVTGVPLSVTFDRVEGMGFYSGDYLELEVMTPDDSLVSIAESCLAEVSGLLGLQAAEHVDQSYVGLLLGWVAAQQLAPR